ncbi:SARP-type DNA-binding transcriptional activator [Gaiella occulta]|uniref:SARP-type DNA-binding transcriptional activator n=1 Tax=Gaiella occulta TaxID=1002870 RepID=A0A7M2YXH5_9ACTN|nr:BTAD domain-containing putative transcriptional regulator [Gaiella occulta]RDI74832.1 SARP-type DNA-binding transcriptional activator [Gaiella occulta]
MSAALQPSKFRIRLFGRLEVARHDRTLGPRDLGGIKPKQVLEILLLARGAHVTRDRLAELLWGDTLPQSTGGALETYVSVLRRRLASGKEGHKVVLTGPGSYRFSIESAEVDLDAFDELVLLAGAAAPRARRDHLEEALALARGEILEDEPYAEWVLDLRDKYREQVQQATLDAANLALTDGDFAGAHAHAQAAMARDRLDERACRAAMRALYALGRRHDALRACERCRALLLQELDVDPMPETEALALSIRCHAEPDDVLPALSSRTRFQRTAPAGGP